VGLVDNFKLFHLTSAERTSFSSAYGNFNEGKLMLGFGTNLETLQRSKNN
jgi:hypothetical protein